MTIVFGFLMASCGNEGTGTAGDSGGGTSGSGVTLNGTVGVPGSTSKSVSFSSEGEEERESGGVSKSASGFASKGSGKKGSGKEAEERVVVSKAVSDVFPTQGTCQVQTLTGTKLDDCLISSGVLTGCQVDVNKLASDKQVELVCEANGKKVTTVCDCSDCANGGALNCGRINGDTTVVDQLMHQQCDPNATPENKTATCISNFSSGVVQPKQVYISLKTQMGLSDATLSADRGKDAMKTIAKAINACYAGGGCNNSADILKALKSPALLDGFKSFDSDLASKSLDFSAVATLASRAAGAAKDFFKDSSTASKWNNLSAIQSWAKSVGAYDATEFKAVSDNPANARGLLNKYADDFKAGVANAFAKMEQGGKSIAQYFEKFGVTSMSSAQVEAAKALFDNLTFSGKDSSTLESLGASCFAQIKACDSDTECNSIKNNPAQYAGTILKDPTALASDDGTIAQQWINQMGTGGSLTGLTPCASDTQCASGQTCSTLTHWCVTSAAGSGNGSGKGGAACSQNSDCEANSCVGGICTFGSGTIFGLKLYGGTCSTTADCVNGMTCSSGTCGFSGGGGGGGSGLANGATCSANGDCASTYCGGPSGTRICKALAGGVYNDVCTTNSQCSSINTCSSGTCQPVCGNATCNLGENGGTCSSDCPIAGNYTIGTETGTCTSNGVALDVNVILNLQAQGGGFLDNNTSLSVGSISGSNCSGVVVVNGSQVTCSTCSISGSGGTTFTFGSCDSCTQLIFSK